MGEQRHPETPAAGVAAQIPVLRSPRYQEVYANGVRFKVTPIDFTMTLGTSPDIPGMANLLQEEVAITLTYSFLKVLSHHLSGLVGAIEREIGPIKIDEKNDPKQEQFEAMAQVLRNTKFVE